ncbi:MAG: hypothetical protein IT377_09170 [Polyangiaceae bacterium]|nr:hypothetical protein [Polyangiaceae bacterium]
MPDREPHADRRRRRRHGPPKGPSQKPPESAARVIAAAKPALDVAKHADVPLTPAEVAEMRVHLRFLKEHRKILALKVNAAEDLLLNGAREPSHRGVCQHLFDKVEKSRVELAAQRLDVGSRLRLLEGIIRFSPDIAYLLLYLESLKDGARPEAVPALTAALRRIDFGAVSAAQMRRVLDLIVELTEERDRPQLLFSLLSSGTFQKAFDASAERLPEALANIVVPLRAAHAVIVRGLPNPFDADALARGTVMLLSLPKTVLESQVPQVCRRLFEAGLHLALDPRSAPGLRVLFDALPSGDRASADAGLALSRWLLARGLEREAKAHFAALQARGVEVPRTWVLALEGRRVGGIGITERAPADDPGRPARELFTSGVLLARQLSVWLRVGTAADAERYAKHVALAKSIALPGVAPIVAHGVTEHGQPYVAVERHGRSANEAVLGKRGLDSLTALSIAAEANAIVGALGLAGVELPDARFRRFAVDDHGRLWLRDLTDAFRSPDAAAQNTLLARELCLDLLARAPRLVVPSAVDTELRQATSPVAIARALEELG